MRNYVEVRADVRDVVTLLDVARDVAADLMGIGLALQDVAEGSPGPEQLYFMGGAVYTAGEAVRLLHDALDGAEGTEDVRFGGDGR